MNKKVGQLLQALVPVLVSTLYFRHITLNPVYHLPTTHGIYHLKFFNGHVGANRYLPVTTVDALASCQVPSREILDEKQTSIYTYPLAIFIKCFSESDSMLSCSAGRITFPKRKQSGNAMVAKQSVLNSLTTLPSVDGDSYGFFSFTVSLIASSAIVAEVRMMTLQTLKEVICSYH